MGTEEYIKMSSDASMAEWEVVEKEDFAPKVGKYSPTYMPKTKENTAKVKDNQKKEDKTFSDWTMVLDFKEDPQIVLPKGNKSEIVYYRKKTQTFQTGQKLNKEITITTDFAFMDKMKFDIKKSFFNDPQHVEISKKRLSHIIDVRLPMFKKYYHDTYDGKADNEIDKKQRDADKECLDFLEAVNSYARNTVTAVQAYQSRKEAFIRVEFLSQSIFKYEGQITELKGKLSLINGEDEESINRRKELEYKISSLSEIVNDYKNDIKDKRIEATSLNAQYKDEAVMSTFIKRYINKSKTLDKDLRMFINPFIHYFNTEFACGPRPEDMSVVKDYSNCTIICSKLKDSAKDKKKGTILEDDYRDTFKNIAMRDCRDEPLFTHTPSVYDVSQGEVGNCYLIAGITAVVNNNPNFIRNMMYDDGQGNVIVRLNYYDSIAEESKPVYYKVKKQVPDTNRYVLSKGPLWVKILEYAYAAYRTDFYAQYNREYAPGLKVKNGTLDIHAEEGGRTSEALAILTGKDVSFYDNVKTDEGFRKFESYIISGDNHFEDHYEKIMTRRSLLSEAPDSYFKGEYSSYADDVFNTINSAVGPGVKEKKLMLASMLSEVETLYNKDLVEATDVYSSSSSSASEMKDASGLLTNHSYTVVGTHVDKNTAIRYVVLKNPWGSYNNNYYKDQFGTVYSRYTDTEKSNGVCIVELNQFLNRLSSISAV